MLTSWIENVKFYIKILYANKTSSAIINSQQVFECQFHSHIKDAEFTILCYVYKTKVIFCLHIEFSIEKYQV